MPRRTRDPFREVSSTPRHNTATPRRTSTTPRRSSATPRRSYSSSFDLSSVNSRIRYYFVWTSNGRYLGIKLD